MAFFRPARQTDLSGIYDVFYENEVLDTPQPPAKGNMPSYLQHVLETGTLYVAEEDGKILAYAGAITRGRFSFLTDLFVRPDEQSGQLGKTLLQAVLPEDGHVHFTVSSSDYRALALYIRAGMRPHWPVFALRLEELRGEWPVQADIECVEASHDDPELVHMDEQIGGRLRPVDHQYWIREEQGIPLWFRREGNVVGYGYVRLNAGTVWYPNACTIGPLGVISPEVSEGCVLAAIAWALQRSEVIHIEVPGPNPCLGTLLERGFRIRYVDTFVATVTKPFFDAQCYIPSGGDLF